MSLVQLPASHLENPLFARLLSDPLAVLVHVVFPDLPTAFPVLLTASHGSLAVLHEAEGSLSEVYSWPFAAPVVAISFHQCHHASPDGEALLLRLQNSRLVLVDGKSLWMAIRYALTIDVNSPQPLTSTTYSLPSDPVACIPFFGQPLPSNVFPVPPCSQFFYAIGEDISCWAVSQSKVKDVVVVVKNMLSSSPFSAFQSLANFTFSAAVSPPPPDHDQSQLLVQKSSINDTPRQFVAVTSSPCSSFCAITDSLGRIWVLNLRNNMLVKLIKGVRGASCGFICSNSSDLPDVRLVVLLPTSIIQIHQLRSFPIKNRVPITDPKIIIQAPRNAKLVYTHGVLGEFIAPSKQRMVHANCFIVSKNYTEIQQVVIYRSVRIFRSGAYDA